MQTRSSGPAVLLAATTALLAAAPSAAAQTGAADARSSSPAVQLAAWRAAHGPSWHLTTNRLTGTLELLFGGAALPSFEPDTNVEADWFRLGREWIEATEAMHGVELAELVAGRFVFLPLGQGTTTDKITVRFDQVIGGVPVEDGRINVLFDTAGRMLSLHATAAPHVEDTAPRPSFDGAFATWIAREAFGRSEGLEPNHYGAPELVFAHVDDQETRRWTLAWQVDAQWTEDGFEPRGYEYTIDARTGQILKRETSIHYLDVTGTISSNATPGVAADHPGNPPAPFPMPYMRVTSSAGQVFTDADGNFTFPGVITPLDVTVGYFGTYTNVNNQAGADYSITFTNVQPNQANALLMNPAPSQTITSQANGFRWIALQRDWIRSIFPTDNTPNFQSTTNVNINDACNAFFDQVSTNYFLAGSAGGGTCNNTGFSSVILHEMGHWLNVRYGTGNGGDGMGEGNADVFSMYQLDDPIVGRFFSTSGGAIRNGNNTRQYCGDGNGGCYGQVHRDGEVWMGAAWKVRNHLNGSLGNVTGDLTANLLFLGWMNSYNQAQIHSIIETQWLTLDDNDGNINNGTPNYAEIDAGFRQQGFPGFELPFVTITNVTQLPTTTNQNGPYGVQANVVAGILPPIASATLKYRVNAGPVQSIAMTHVSGDTYAASIPGQSSPSLVEYLVEGSDSGGNAGAFPSAEIGQGLYFAVGQVDTVLAADFEGGASGWSHGGGNATTGHWVHGNPIGTAAQPEDDHTAAPGVNCWFTGQGSPGGAVGAADVDGGDTLLLSPVFDLTGVDVARVSYWRWYDNTRGGAPNSDVLQVYLSNNGGASWTLAETVGPGGPQNAGNWYRGGFTVGAFLAPTANMRLRFRASDLGTGSIVEAAIDDVQVTAVSSTLPAPVNYCVASPNSTGFQGGISFTGSQRIPLNDAGLMGQGLPLGAFGLFFFGDQQAQNPIAGTQGTMCVGGTILRLEAVQSNPFFGTAQLALDFASQTSNARFITAGSTWNFQLWYRDAIGGSPTSNTTNGVQVMFGD